MRTFPGGCLAWLSWSKLSYLVPMPACTAVPCAGPTQLACAIKSAQDAPAGGALLLLSAQLLGLVRGDRTLGESPLFGAAQCDARQGAHCWQQPSLCRRRRHLLSVLPSGAALPACLPWTATTHPSIPRAAPLAHPRLAHLLTPACRRAAADRAPVAARQQPADRAAAAGGVRPAAGRPAGSGAAGGCGRPSQQLRCGCGRAGVWQAGLALLGCCGVAVGVQLAAGDRH